MFTYDPTYWPALRRLEPAFFAQLQRFYIFAEGEHALLWTHEDRVYHLTATPYDDNDDCGQCTAKPVELPELSGRRVCYADQGEHFVVLHSGETGDLWLLSTNACGSVFAQYQHGPTLVARGIHRARASKTHVVMVDCDGAVWTLGENRYGQLGLPKDRALAPELVVDLLASEIVEVACDRYATYALTATGYMYHWGTFDGRFTYEQPEHLHLPQWLAQTVATFHVADSRLVMLDAWGTVYCARYTARHELRLHVWRSTKLVHVQRLVSLGPYCGIVQDTRHVYYLCTGNDLQCVTRMEDARSAADLAALCGYEVTPAITWISDEARRAEVIVFNNPTLADALVKVEGRTIYCSSATLLERSRYFARQLHDHAHPWRNELIAYANTMPVHAATFLYLRYLHTGHTGHIRDFLWPLYSHVAWLEDGECLAQLAAAIAARLVSLRFHRKALRGFLRSNHARRSTYVYGLLRRDYAQRRQPDSTLAARVVRFLVEPLRPSV